MKNSFFLLVGVVFIAGSLLLFLSQPAPQKYSSKSPGDKADQPQAGQFVEIDIGQVKVWAEVAVSDKERERGLSGRESLEERSGMLFVFPKPDFYGIWMKDMNFAIDIVWIDKEKRIIWMEKSVSPDTFPKVFYSQAPAKYVLELPAGFLLEHRIDTGLLVSWSGGF